MKDVKIVDRGRGPQLSTSRITVQDLFPYLQQQYTHDQIREVMPVLTKVEIETVEQYIKANLPAVTEHDRRIRARAAARCKAPEVQAAERQARQERLAQARERIRQAAQEPSRDSAAR